MKWPPAPGGNTIAHEVLEVSTGTSSGFGGAEYFGHSRAHSVFAFTGDLRIETRRR